MEEIIFDGEHFSLVDEDESGNLKNLYFEDERGNGVKLTYRYQVLIEIETY